MAVNASGPRFPFARRNVARFTYADWPEMWITANKRAFHSRLLVLDFKMLTSRKTGFSTGLSADKPGKLCQPVT